MQKRCCDCGWLTAVCQHTWTCTHGHTHTCVLGTDGNNPFRQPCWAARSSGWAPSPSSRLFRA